MATCSRNWTRPSPRRWPPAPRGPAPPGERRRPVPAVVRPFPAQLTCLVLSIQRVDMERKDKVLNLRVSDRQRTVYERAAALEGISVSALVTSAADARADEVLHAHVSMTVAAHVFDNLLAALDRPTALAPPLEK